MNNNFKSQFKRNSTLLGDGFDESGYASFQGAQSLHNSTVDTSPLFGADAENCLNLSNITHNHKSIKSTQHRRAINSAGATIQLAVTPQFRSQDNKFASDSSSKPLNEDSIWSSPLPNQIHSATKRRKDHSKQRHISQKKSKKRLNFLVHPDYEPQGRTRYYNGEENLDIIGMLDTLPALELILKLVDSVTLDAMSQVSLRWQQLVYNRKHSAERLHSFHRKQNLTKENTLQFSTKKTRLNSFNTLPFKNFNTTTSSSADSNLTSSAAGSDGVETDSQLVEHDRRVKCPWCGKSSKTFHLRNTNLAAIHSRSHLSRTLPTFLTFNTETEPKAPMPRFHSFDAMLNPANEFTEEATFAQCTNTCCKFKFCLQCSCSYHPGENCRVSEMGTPSKMMTMPNENTTPPKYIQKIDSKLSRKKSLKRLCF